jgi:hypothetical protein
MGHSRRFARVFPMSGLASTADVPDTMAIVAFGPTAELPGATGHHPCMYRTGFSGSDVKMRSISATSDDTASCFN